MPITIGKPHSTPIYSFAALKSRQREVKDRANSEIVHLTENGNAAYILCSEEVFARELAKAADEARFDQELREAIERGRADIAAGRYVSGLGNIKASLHDAWDEK